MQVQISNKRWLGLTLGHLDFFTKSAKKGWQTLPQRGDCILLRKCPSQTICKLVTLFHEIMSIFTIANKSVKNEKMANIHYFVSLVPMSSLFQMFWKQQMMIAKLSLWYLVGVDVSWIKWNRKNLLKWRILGCIKGKKS